jgi:hypothetical protein
VHQTSTVEDLAPGTPAQALSGNFDNPNDGPVYVTSVTVSIASIDSPGTCTVDDYTLVQPHAVDAEVPAGNGQGGWSGGSIAFNDNPTVNQDGCKGATVHLAYDAS